MKSQLLLMLAVASSLAACATTSSVPAGMQAGKFVAFSCEGESFQARFNPDGNTVRVRAHHGATELSAAGDGIYQGDGVKLMTRSAGGPLLERAGKVVGKNCKPA